MSVTYPPGVFCTYSVWLAELVGMVSEAVQMSIPGVSRFQFDNYTGIQCIPEACGNTAATEQMHQSMYSLLVVVVKVPEHVRIGG